MHHVERKGREHKRTAGKRYAKIESLSLTNKAKDQRKGITVQYSWNPCFRNTIFGLKLQREIYCIHTSGKSQAYLETNIYSTTFINLALVLHEITVFAHEHICNSSTQAHPVVTMKPSSSPNQSLTSMPFFSNPQG